MNAYIISYFGQQRDIKNFRISFHYQQLCSLLQQQGLQHIHILAMDYDDPPSVSLKSDYLLLDHPRIHYHYSALVPPSQARNQLIDIFGASDDDWGLFLDNDAAIDHRLQGGIVIPVLEKNKSRLNLECDVIVPYSPRHQAWSQWADQHREQMQTHLPIERSNYMKTSVFFLKNRQKLQQPVIYFDAELRELEDYEYVPRVLSQGGSIWQLPTVLMWEWGLNTSTLFNTNTQDSEEQHQLRALNRDSIRQNILEKYAPYGAVKNGTKINYMRMQRHSRPREIWLPIAEDRWGNGLFSIE